MMDRNCDAHTSPICFFHVLDMRAALCPIPSRLASKMSRPRRRCLRAAIHACSAWAVPIMILASMPASGPHSTRDAQPPAPSSAPGNSIPPRTHYSRPPRNPSIPAQPTVKTHTIRMAIATAIGVAVMFALLMLAAQYLQRDWARKQQKAKSPRANSSMTTAEAETPEAPGWSYELRPNATKRQMDRLRSDRFVANGWFILSRGLSDKTDPRILLAGLRMALATGGESAELKNEMGVLHLRQKRMKEAAVQFRTALQITPGFPPALFNLALCTIAERKPAQAIQLLGRYLGRHPGDIAALRLQSTLLSQLGEPLESLHMLEKFLKDQPPGQPLFLEAAALAARLGQNGKALRYLETSIAGNPIQAVVRIYQSPAFREIRLSGEGDALASRIAAQARVTFGAPLPVDEIQPIRALSPDAAKSR